MAGVTDFLNQYHDMLIAGSPELLHFFEEGGRLFGWQLSALLKESPNKRVFTVKSIKTNEVRVLKIAHQDSYENLEQEYRFLSSVESCNKGFVKVYDFFSENSYDYLLEEYISGSNLQALKEAEKTFSVRKIIQTGIEMCDILHVMHSQNPPLIHRDITPSNIIRTSTGILYLIDLGIARQFEPSKERDTVFIGTEDTAPPEQYGYAQTDARSDIYSLGMLLLYLATGGYDPNLLEDKRVPDKLKKIILKCIEFAPAMRFKNVMELKSALLRLDKKGYEDNCEVLWKQIYRLRRKTHVCIAFLALAIALLLFWGYYDFVRPNVPYHFVSPEVEAAVRQELALEEDAVITRKDLGKVRELYIHGDSQFESFRGYDYYSDETYLNGVLLDNGWGNIECLDDFYYMENLTSLGLCNQKISDLEPLAKLPLKELYLGGNVIGDITPLEECTSLEVLCLSKNPLIEYDVLHGMESLQELEICGNNIDNLDFIENMDLKELYLESSKVLDGDFTVLSSQKHMVSLQVECSSQPPEYLLSMTELNTANLYRYPSADLSYLKNCVNMETLFLHNGGLASVEGVESMPKLTLLDVSGTLVEDLTPVMQLEKLRELGVESSKVTTELELWMEEHEVAQMN